MSDEPKKKKSTRDTREAARLRKQKRRDKERLGNAALSPGDQRKVLEDRWIKNRDALSPQDRAALEARVEEATRIHNLMIKGSRLMRAGTEYGAEGCFIDLMFEEIETFARKYPPSDGVSFSELLDREALHGRRAH